MDNKAPHATASRSLQSHRGLNAALAIFDLFTRANIVSS
jgi:hypothetical protein